MLRHGLRLARLPRRRRRAGERARGAAARGLRRRPAAHRVRHLALPAAHEGEVRVAAPQVCHLRARAVHRTLPAEGARLLQGARQRGRPCAVLLQEAQAQRSDDRARREVRARGGGHAHPLLRHGGRPRHALPRADGVVAAAPRPAELVLRRLLYLAHVRDVALQPLGHQLPQHTLPRGRGHHRQAQGGRRLEVAPQGDPRRVEPRCVPRDAYRAAASYGVCVVQAGEGGGHGGRAARTTEFCRCEVEVW
mmetsp:Transcript_16180/g.38458  ORF Transcript_16180/g.38458 Transcript_16180/m.38458 type:complete len:250 (+) Transcript_16180:1177-1926(+)